MVILVSGISFAGYALVKIIGPQRSAPLIGLLGGLASSTAVTVSFAQRSKQNVELSRILALGTLLASTTMFPRVLIEVAAANSALLPLVIMPLLAMAAMGLLVVGWLWRQERRREHTAEVQFENPFSVLPALKFALLFVMISVISKAAFDFLGTRALYFTAVLAGLTDVDAITLSTARLARGSLDASIAAATIILATMSNTLMKGGMAFLFGATSFGWQVALGLGLILLVGALSLMLV